MKSISCIVPVFNLDSGQNWERFCTLIKSLSRAARSFIPKYFEVIIINDDPKSNKTIEISCLFSEVGMKECLRMLSNSLNMGQAYSRNMGSYEAANEYLHFMDQDDYINESFYSALNYDSEIDFFIANPVFYLENSNKEIVASSFITRMMYKRASHLNQLWLLLFSNIAYSPGQVIIKKTKFIEAGRFPELKNRGSDDYGLFYNLAINNIVTIFYMKTAVFVYRIHGNQNSKILNMNNSINEFFADIRATTFREKMIKKMKIVPFWRPFSKLAYVFFFKRAIGRHIK